MKLICTLLVRDKIYFHHIIMSPHKIVSAPYLRNGLILCSFNVTKYKIRYSNTKCT